MCTEKCVAAVAPKKFLCCLPLRVGAFIIGILFAIIMGIYVIATSVQVYYASQKFEGDKKNKASYADRNSYSYSIVAVIYSIFLFLLCLWFILGVLNRKTTTILSWLVITALWWGQTFCLLFVLIYLHSLGTDFVSWIVALIFGLILIGILAYCLLVVLGYWYELKLRKEEVGAAA